jgi:hypothetical protein
VLRIFIVIIIPEPQLCFNLRTLGQMENTIPLYRRERQDIDITDITSFAKIYYYTFQNTALNGANVALILAVLITRMLVQLIVLDLKL